MQPLAWCAYYVDGSFVSTKELPGDYDACWESDELTDFSRLDPVFSDFSLGRLAQKTRFGGEFFPAFAIADGDGNVYRDFFQRSKRRRDCQRGSSFFPLMTQKGLSDAHQRDYKRTRLSDCSC